MTETMIKAAKNLRDLVRTSQLNLDRYEVWAIETTGFSLDRDPITEIARLAVGRESFNHLYSYVPSWLDEPIDDVELLRRMEDARSSLEEANPSPRKWSVYSTTAARIRNGTLLGTLLPQLEQVMAGIVEQRLPVFMHSAQTFVCPRLHKLFAYLGRKEPASFYDLVIDVGCIEKAAAANDWPWPHETPAMFHERIRSVRSKEKYNLRDQLATVYSLGDRISADVAATSSAAGINCHLIAALVEHWKTQGA